MKLHYQRTVLPNGLRVLSCVMPHTYSVGVGLYLSVGSRYEDDRWAGAAHFVEHVLFKGSKHYPSPQAIASLVEGHGGLFNASTGRETTVFWIKLPQAHLPLALDLLADLLRASLLRPEDVEKERAVILEEITASQDVPEELVSLVAYELTWPNHPLGRDVAGTVESVSGLSRQMLQDFLAQRYAPQNAVLSVAGDVRHDQVVQMAAELLGDWQPTQPVRFDPAPQNSSTSRLSIVSRTTEQTHLTLHLPGLARKDEDRFALGLLNVILGEGMSSRLVQEVRERLGLAYAVDSYVSYLSDTGIVGIYAAVAPAQAQNALRLILDQVWRLCDEQVDDATLQVAKEFAKGRLLLSLEDTMAVVNWFGRQEVLAQPLLLPEEVVERLEAVTAADVQQVARRLFAHGGFCLAVVGPHQDDEVAAFRQLLNRRGGTPAVCPSPVSPV